MDRGGDFRMKPKMNSIPYYNKRHHTENILVAYKQFYKNWYPTDSRLLNYKEFVMLYLDDDIQPTEANRRYEQYKTTMYKNGGFKIQKDENRLKDHHHNHPSNMESAKHGRNGNGQGPDGLVAENGIVKEESFLTKERMLALMDEEFFAHIVTLESPFICGVKDCYKGFAQVEDGLRHLSESHGGIAQPCILKAIYYLNDKPLPVPAQGRPICHYDDLDGLQDEGQEIDYTRNDYRL